VRSIDKHGLRAREIPRAKQLALLAQLGNEICLEHFPAWKIGQRRQSATALGDLRAASTLITEQRRQSATVLGDLRAASTLITPESVPWKGVTIEEELRVTGAAIMFVVLGSHRSLRPLHGIVSSCLLLTICGCSGGGAGGGYGPSASNGSGGNNPMPAISSVAPASAAAGAAAQTLAINGSGFTSSSTVTYNGAAHTVSYVSSTQLTVQLSAADLATAGSYAVIATNPAPGGGDSNSVNFTVTVVNNPMPAITGLAPVSAVSGTAAQTLTIYGSGFTSSSTVTYNGAAHTASYVSSTQLTVPLSAADQMTVGSYPVVVTNPVPGGGGSNAANFTVSPATTPTSAIALIVGGQSATTVLKSAELFDAYAGAFSSTGDMLVARFRPTASLLPGGTAVLVAGGSDASAAALNSAELYQVGTKTFVATALNMKCAHKGHTATLLPNGTVLIAGRDGLAACAELYDPSTGVFTRTGDMTTPVSDHAAALLQNGKVLIVGGSIDAVGCQSCVATNTAELFDPSTGTFTATTHKSVLARINPTATLLPNGKVLIAFGQATPTGGLELYDPSTGVFTLTGSLNIKRQFHTATLLNSGHVLLAGGMINGQATIGAELYDPTPGSFSVTGSMSTARSYQTATLLGNGFVLVAGGTTQLNTGVINTADLYDSSTGVFGQTGNMVTGRYGAAAAPLQ
jgi:hypothetical protein